MPTHDGPRREWISAAGRTDVGHVRTHNEDAYLVAALGEGTIISKGATGVLTVDGGPALLVVADGVGGAVSGEIASLMAIDTMLIDLRRQYASGALRDRAAVSLAIEDAMAAANYVIYTYAMGNPHHRGMATTATVAIWYAGEFVIAQVGDSRAYLVHDGVARQVTKDQSLVQRLLDAGEITADQAAHSERRNIILQALGSEAVVVPDIYHEAPEDGDILVLCSDGLSNQVSDEEIGRFASTNADLGSACDQLIDLANARGGHDNITVVAARVSLRQAEPEPEVIAESSIPPVVPDATRVKPAYPTEATPESTRPGFVDRVRRWLR